MSDVILDVQTDGGTPVSDGRAVNDEDIRELLARERAARASERARREAAEARAAGAERGVAEARSAVAAEVLARFQAQEASFDGQMASTETEAASLAQRLAALMGEGNFTEAAEVQRQIARAEARAESLAVQKAMLLRDRRQIEAAAATQTERATAAPNAGGLDMTQFSPAERQWIRAHPEYLEDRKLQQKLVAAHHQAVADDIEVQSPEYFRRFDAVYEAHTGAAPPAPPEAEPAEASPPAPRRAATLPVARRGGERETGAAAGGPIRLSPEEREAADISLPDIPVNDYTAPDGTKRPGRYRAYHDMQVRLRAEGRMR